MQIIKTTFDAVTDLVAGIISGQKECCVYCVGDEPCAIVGSNGGASVRAIQAQGIRMVKINHEGGTIVASPGDVQIGIFTVGYSGRDYRDRIVERIVAALKANGHDAVVADNDLLVNGKKVVGFGSRMFGRILYTAIQVSVDVNMGLIRTICTKPMMKTPDGLKNYGITTQDIVDILFDVLQNNQG